MGIFSHYVEVLDEEPKEKEEFIETINKSLDFLKNKPMEFRGYTVIVSPGVYDSLKVTIDINELKDKLHIRNVLANHKKRVVTVVFEDGTHEIIKCSWNDEFDINVGVALAVMRKIYGSKNKYHQDIKKHLKEMFEND